MRTSTNDQSQPCQALIALSALRNICMGRAVETESHVKEAVRLSPRDINAYWWMFCVGLAKMQLGAYAEAAIGYGEALRPTGIFLSVHFHLASALALARGHWIQARYRCAGGTCAHSRLHHFVASMFHKSSDNPSYLAGFERLL